MIRKSFFIQFFLIFAFAIFNCNVIFAQTPTPDKSQAFPYLDKDIISGIASIVAILISVIAIRVSSKQSEVQRRREKREELRNIIEKLASLREEYGVKYAKTLDVMERQNLSVSSNIKRSIYLQSAEALAEELKEDVSSSEYSVIGFENELESDFRQARKYYHLAVKYSLKSSLVNQVTSIRYLAGSYYWLEPYGDFPKGRNLYEKAVKLLKDETDPYLIYTKSYTYRNWAGKEAWQAKDLTLAMEKLQLAYDNIQTISIWYNLKFEELRLIADLWRLLGNQFYSEKDAEKARFAFEKSLEVIKELNDDNSNDIRGQIYQDWGYHITRLDVTEGTKLLKQAHLHYEGLPALYPSREMRLRFLAQAITQLAAELNTNIKLDEQAES
jgi:tetratricopeptide (TPR) repeat protein